MECRLFGVLVGEDFDIVIRGKHFNLLRAVVTSNQSQSIISFQTNF